MLSVLPEVPFLTGWCLLVQAELELNGGSPAAVLALLARDRAGDSPAGPCSAAVPCCGGCAEAALTEVEPLTAGGRLGVAAIEAWW